MKRGKRNDRNKKRSELYKANKGQSLCESLRADIDESRSIGSLMSGQSQMLQISDSPKHWSIAQR